MPCVPLDNAVSLSMPKGGGMTNTYDRRVILRRGLEITLGSVGATLLAGCDIAGAPVASSESGSEPSAPASQSPAPDYPWLQFDTIHYASSIDPSRFPRIRMTVAFDRREAAEDGPLPLLVLGHGTNQRDTDFSIDVIARFAGRGFFVAVPDMRTNEGWLASDGYESSGRDSQGRMTTDVIDAMRVLALRYKDYIDFDRRIYSGYSGSEALALAMKAPWAFDLIVAHFGIADYSEHLAAGGTVQLASRTPGGYASRNAVVGVPMNRRAGHLILAWDAEDRYINITSQQKLVDALKKARATPFTHYKSQIGDMDRFTHGLPSDANADFGGIETRWSKAALRGEYRRGQPPEAGSGYYVPGYLWLGDPMDDRTPHILLGDGDTAGQQHAAHLDFDLGRRQFALTPLNGPTPAAIRWGELSTTQTLTETTVLQLE